MSLSLTDTQRRVLEFMHGFHRSFGWMPTRVEIARNFGWKSPNAAESHLQAMRSGGFITLNARHSARAVTITPLGLQTIGASNPMPGGPNLIALPVIDPLRIRSSKGGEGAQP